MCVGEAGHTPIAHSGVGERERSSQCPISLYCEIAPSSVKVIQGFLSNKMIKQVFLNNLQRAELFPGARPQWRCQGSCERWVSASGNTSFPPPCSRTLVGGAGMGECTDPAAGPGAQTLPHPPGTVFHVMWEAIPRLQCGLSSWARGSPGGAEDMIHCTLARPPVTLGLAGGP